MSLKVALYALLRFHILTTRVPGIRASAAICCSGFGLFSMFLAAPFILVQTNLKRMLAYSSLEHVGLICVGIGLNTPVTIFGALLHMGYHALTKPVLFFAAGNIHQTFHTLEFRVIGPGVVKVLPVTVLLHGPGRGGRRSGLPPFGLFCSEMTVLSGGFAARQTTDQRADPGGAAGVVLRHPPATHPHPARARASGDAGQRRAPDWTACRPWSCCWAACCCSACGCPRRCWH